MQELLVTCDARVWTPGSNEDVTRSMETFLATVEEKSIRFDVSLELSSDLDSTRRVCSTGLPKVFVSVFFEMLAHCEVFESTFRKCVELRISPQEALCRGDAIMRAFVQSIRRSIELSPDCLGFNGSDKSESTFDFQRSFVEVSCEVIAAQLSLSEKCFFCTSVTNGEVAPFALILPLIQPSRLCSSRKFIDIVIESILASCWAQGSSVIVFPLSAFTFEIAQHIVTSLSAFLIENMKGLRCVVMSLPPPLCVDAIFPFPVMVCNDDVAALDVAHNLCSFSQVSVSVVLFGSDWRDLDKSNNAGCKAFFCMTNVSKTLDKYGELKLEWFVDSSDLGTRSDLPQWVPCVRAIESELLALHV